MKSHYRVLALAALLAAPAAWAQTQGGGAAAPATGKTGVLNVRQAIVSTAEGKQAQAELQSQFAPRQTEMDSLNKQIEDLRNRLRACDRTCSDDEKARLQREGEVRTRQLQRKNDDLTEDLNAAQGEVIDRIGRKMLDILDRYARENSYTVVFDTSAQNTPVIYASNTVDVTQDIIRLYDQAYPVKAGAVTPAQPRTQPGAAKPPAPTPKPTQPAPKPPSN